MKIGLYADPHISQSSSIIVGRKGEFTGRLDNLIKSFDWMHRLFAEKKVDMIFCLGDVTDKPNLTAEEITAMSKCDLEDHWLLVGNHCRSDKDGKINALATYKRVISEPRFLTDDIFVIPYNHDTVDLSQLDHRPRIILSHNDIKGYDFGAGHTSTEGYEISDILDNCDLYVNGHLHNGAWVVKDRILNLGALSGMNFSSCGGEWEPSVAILDTNLLDIQLYENPEAYRFKKVEFNTLPKLKGYLDNLPEGHYVVQVKVPDTIAQKARKLLDQSSKVEASRVLTYKKVTKSKSTTKTETKLNTEVNVYDKLKTFVSQQKPKYSLDVINNVIDKIAQKEEGVE